MAIVGLAMAACSSAGVPGTPQPPAPASLVRDGTEPVLSRRADLDGDGVAEIILVARSTDEPQLQVPPQYLDVFAYRGGRWARVFAATDDTVS